MDMKDQKLATEIAEERMTLIAPLLSQNLDKDSVRLIRAEICERNQISQRTLERYLTSYLKGGFDALKPQSRSAECKYKIPQELLDEAIRLRRELPSRSVPTIIKILELEGKAEPGFLKRTTLHPGVQDVHHLHIWAISTTETALTAHIVIKDTNQMETVKHEIKHELEHVGVQHATLEFETTGACCSEPCCE